MASKMDAEPECKPYSTLPLILAIIIIGLVVVFIIFRYKEQRDWNIFKGMPILIGGANDVLRTLMTKRYNALTKFIQTRESDFTSPPFEQFFEETRHYKNEVEYLLRWCRNKYIHHSPGDLYAHTITQLNNASAGTLFITDDVVGFNNAMSLKEPIAIYAKAGDWQLLAYVNKFYECATTPDQSYITKCALSNGKVSYPFYLHAMYVKQHSSTMNLPLPPSPPIITVAHYNSDCVFSTIIAIICSCGEDVVQNPTGAIGSELLKIIRGQSRSSLNLAKLCNYDPSTPLSTSVVCSKDFPLYRDTKIEFVGNATTSQSPWFITTNRSMRSRAQAYSICVSRLGTWISFYHNIAFIRKGSKIYVADDMTYTPQAFSSINAPPLSNIALEEMYYLIQK